MGHRSGAVAIETATLAVAESGASKTNRRAATDGESTSTWREKRARRR